MVQETQVAELAESDVDLAEIDLAEASSDDPVATLRTELAAVQSELAELRGLKRLDPDAVNRALGHVPRLQRDFDEIRRADPIASIDPRLSSSEEVLEALVDSLVGSDLLDDSSKASLRQARQRLDTGRTQRDKTRLRRELLSEVRDAREAVQADTPNPAQTALVIETVRIQAYAEGKGVDFGAIPREVLDFKPGEDVARAATRVRAEIDRLAGEVAGADRVAGRRRAAGAGAPASNGAGAFRSQREVDTAHMEGRLTSAQVNELRGNGRYGALPY